MVLYFTKWKGENKDDNLIKLESLRGTMVKDFNNFCRIEVIFAYKSCKETEAWFTSRGHPQLLVKKKLEGATAQLGTDPTRANSTTRKALPICNPPVYIAKTSDVSEIFYEDSYLIT